MKNRRVFLITCVIALSFAGIGYSTWTEGLNIKSLFATGNIHVVFHDPVIVNDELCEISADADENILEIYGTVVPGTTVMIEYDIYNDSSIPMKYDPDDEALPEGITLDQDETVLKPGEYHRGNQLTIEPGENELILPFVQYNSSDSGGWKEELKICWNITVVEEAVEPELDLNVPQAEEPTEVVPETESPSEGVPETESPVTDTTPGVEPTPGNDLIDTDPDPVNEPADDPTVVDAPSEAPPINENLNEATKESETVTETSDENVTEDNTDNTASTETDEGSEENVKDGEE